MLSIKVTGMAEAVALAQGFSDRRARAVLATALTRTAIEARAAAEQELVRAIDRPTTYTRRALYVVTATGEQVNAGQRFVSAGNAAAPWASKAARSAYLRAEVAFKDELSDTGKGGTPATKYMLPHVDGQSRRVKRYERALMHVGALPQGWMTVPGAGARIDGYGNVSPGQINQILSQVATEMTAGYNRSMSRDAGKRRAAVRRAGGRFIVVQPGAQIHPGIYQREAMGRHIVPVLLFVRTARYRARYDFYGVVQRTAEQRLDAHVRRAIDEHIARLQGRAGQ